ncbi:hypothetical protein C8R44DRAFT_745772 [Mycena epipterygia]|nr:hypothetical protein C8R44DRAFT_745772 [Mycena epipterygia]
MEIENTLHILNAIPAVKSWDHQFHSLETRRGKFVEPVKLIGLLPSAIRCQLPQSCRGICRATAPKAIKVHLPVVSSTWTGNRRADISSTLHECMNSGNLIQHVDLLPPESLSLLVRDFGIPASGDFRYNGRSTVQYYLSSYGGLLLLKYRELTLLPLTDGSTKYSAIK